MARFWMVRCGRNGDRADDFFEKGVVAIGYEVVNLTNAQTPTDVRKALQAIGKEPSVQSVAILSKFRSKMQPGDQVVTYAPSTRLYRLGEVTGEYRYDTKLIPGVSHVRAVKWAAESVLRDNLSAAARNTLGSTLTLFEPGDEVRDEFTRLMSGAVPKNDVASAKPQIESVPTDDFESLRENTLERAHESIKDRISILQWDELQELVAAILRAMGYKTRVSPAGPDRGKDIVASPDGLGLSPPRIKVEVKHRDGQMGAPAIRSFVGGLRGEDRGLYVSTGGFTREAHYEAERSQLPVSLIDLDVLAELLVQHYENLDTDGKSLVPLTRVYLPTRGV